MIKVGVIFGGESVEHEVSIITAVQAMSFIDPNKYEVVPIYIAKDRRWYTGNVLKNMNIYRDMEMLPRVATEVSLIRKDDQFLLQKKKGLIKGMVESIDIAFPIVHGKGVEDGSLAGYLESLGIPYVGPSVLGAAIGQDKIVLKQILKSSNIPVTDYIWFYDNEYEENEGDILKQIKKLGYPIIVKPAKLGSSVGISIAHDEEEVKASIVSAIKYDEKILVEEVVENLMEVDCAVIGTYKDMECSLIGEMLTTNDFLTFEDKYIGEGSKKTKMGGTKSNGSISTPGFKIPAKLDKEVEEQIYKYSKEAFRVLNLSGITRFDFLVDKKKKQVYVNEPNTIPGCLAFFFFTPKGKDYTTLLDELLISCVKEYKDSKKKVTSFESNVLSTFDGSKGNKTKMM